MTKASESAASRDFKKMSGSIRIRTEFEYQKFTKNPRRYPRTDLPHLITAQHLLLLSLSFEGKQAEFNPNRWSEIFKWTLPSTIKSGSPIETPALGFILSSLRNQSDSHSQAALFRYFSAIPKKYASKSPMIGFYKCDLFQKWSPPDVANECFSSILRIAHIRANFRTESSIRQVGNQIFFYGSQSASPQMLKEAAADFSGFGNQIGNLFSKILLLRAARLQGDFTLFFSISKQIEGLVTDQKAGSKDPLYWEHAEYHLGRNELALARTELEKIKDHPFLLSYKDRSLTLILAKEQNWESLLIAVQERRKRPEVRLILSSLDLLEETFAKRVLGKEISPTASESMKKFVNTDLDVLGHRNKFLDMAETIVTSLINGKLSDSDLVTLIWLRDYINKNFFNLSPAPQLIDQIIKLHKIGINSEGEKS